MKNTLLVLAIATTIAIVNASTVLAQQSAQQTIEAARAKAQETGIYREALADPDQSVRLATFEAMIGSKDPILVELALENGLASSDRVLRGLAFRHAILSRSTLVLNIAADPSAGQSNVEKTKKYIAEHGNQLTIRLYKVDMNTGSFEGATMRARVVGNVSGLVIDYGNYGNVGGSTKGRLALQEDGTVGGMVFETDRQIGGQFLANATIR